MSTHALGADTENLPVNFLREQKRLLGRLAARWHDRSTGALVRRLVLKGLEAEDRAAAAKWREIARTARGAVLLVVGLIAVAQTFGPQADQPMRRAGTVRVRRVEQRD